MITTHRAHLQNYKIMYQYYICIWTLYVYYIYLYIHIYTKTVTGRFGIKNKLEHMTERTGPEVGIKKLKIIQSFLVCLGKAALPTLLNTLPRFNSQIRRGNLLANTGHGKNTGKKGKYIRGLGWREETIKENGLNEWKCS